MTPLCHSTTGGPVRVARGFRTGDYRAVNMTGLHRVEPDRVRTVGGPGVEHRRLALEGCGIVARWTRSTARERSPIEPCERTMT